MNWIKELSPSAQRWVILYCWALCIKGVGKNGRAIAVCSA